MKQKDGFLEAFKPNGTPNKKIQTSILLVWICLFVFAWIGSTDLFPKPSEVLERLQFLISERNLLGELFNTYTVLCKAMLWTMCVSLGMVYLSVIPFFRHPIILVTLLRFLGMTGLTYFVFRVFGTTEMAKVFILGFGMSTWYVTSMYKTVAEITELQYDHARSLGWSEWRVVGEVVILGKAHVAFETMRQIFAMAFMMVTLVEGLVKEQGGIGVMLLHEEKHMKLADIVAVLSVLLIVALIQDLVFSWLGGQLFPYAVATTERK